jgi:hypothetical protein
MPQDLTRHACRHHRYPTSGRHQRWPLETASDAQDLILPITAMATTIEPLITLAEKGNGLACVPGFAIRQQIADGRLIVLDEFTKFTGTFRAFWPADRFVAPKVRVFVDFLAENLFPKSSRLAEFEPDSRRVEISTELSLSAAQSLLTSYAAGSLTLIIYRWAHRGVLKAPKAA